MRQDDIISGMKSASVRMLISWITMALGVILMLNLWGDYRTSPEWRLIWAVTFVVLVGGGFVFLVLNTINYIRFQDMKIAPKPRRAPNVVSSGTRPLQAELEEEERPVEPFEDIEAVGENEQVPPQFELILLEVETRPGQTKRLSGYEYTYPEWGRLYDELRRSKWVWSKRRLTKTELFIVSKIGKSITAQDVYEEITADFMEVEAVEGEKARRRVTKAGQVALQKAARRQVVS